MSDAAVETLQQLHQEKLNVIDHEEVVESPCADVEEQMVVQPEEIHQLPTVEEEKEKEDETSEEETKKEADVEVKEEIQKDDDVTEEAKEEEGVDADVVTEVTIEDKKSKLFGVDGRAARFYRTVRNRIGKGNKKEATEAKEFDANVTLEEEKKEVVETIEEEKEGEVEKTEEAEEKTENKKVSRSASFYDAFRARFGKTKMEKKAESTEETAEETATIEVTDETVETEKKEETTTETDLSCARLYKKEEKVARKGSFYASVRARLARTKKAADEKAAADAVTEGDTKEEDTVAKEDATEEVNLNDDVIESATTQEVAEKTPWKTRISQRVRGVFRKGTHTVNESVPTETGPTDNVKPLVIPTETAPVETA